MTDVLKRTIVQAPAPPPVGPQVVRLFVERLRVPALAQPRKMLDTREIAAHPAVQPYLGILVRNHPVASASVNELHPWEILVAGFGGQNLSDCVCDIVGLRVHMADAVRLSSGCTFYTARLLHAGSLRTGVGAGVVWREERP